MIAIGIGCRRGAGKDAILALIAEARARVAVTGDSGGGDTLALFTGAHKRDEAGLLAAAEALGWPLYFLPPAALRAVEDRVLTRSPHAEAALGLASVSEAAALVGAGADARLLLPRIAANGVTCAIAKGTDR